MCHEYWHIIDSLVPRPWNIQRGVSDLGGMARAVQIELCQPRTPAFYWSASRSSQPGQGLITLGGVVDDQSVRRSQTKLCVVRVSTTALKSEADDRIAEEAVGQKHGSAPAYAAKKAEISQQEAAGQLAVSSGAQASTPEKPRSPSANGSPMRMLTPRASPRSGGGCFRSRRADVGIARGHRLATAEGDRHRRRHQLCQRSSGDPT